MLSQYSRRFPFHTEHIKPTAAHEGLEKDWVEKLLPDSMKIMIGGESFDAVIDSKGNLTLDRPPKGFMPGSTVTFNHRYSPPSEKKSLVFLTAGQIKNVFKKL